MGEGNDFDGVLATTLVDDRVREMRHDVVVHALDRCRPPHRRPAVRRAGNGIESRADIVQEPTADCRGPLVVEASSRPEIGARLPRDEKVQLSTPAETALDFSAGLRPRKKLAATLLDILGSPLELLDPLGVETSVGASVDALEKLSGDLDTISGVEP
jgi:hypothetical protein